MHRFHPGELNIGRFNFLISAFARKFRNVARDPILRKWLIGRLLGRYSSPPAFQSHRPPYLTEYPRAGAKAACSTDTPHAQWEPLSQDHCSLNLPLAGMDVSVTPDAISDLFKQQFSDTETLLSLQRFAWVPLLGEALDPAWVDAI